MQDMTFIELLKLSIVMPILLVCSIVMLAYILERFIGFKKAGGINTVLADRIKVQIRNGNNAKAIEICNRTPGAVARALEASLSAAHLARSEMESVFALYRQKIQLQLSKNLGVFGTLSFISPLLGLMGTVLGVIRAFRDLALAGSGGPSIVAAGIAEALVATAMGIAVAVTAAVFYNVFTFWQRRILTGYDILAQEIMIILYSGTGQGGHARS